MKPPSKAHASTSSTKPNHVWLGTYMAQGKGNHSVLPMLQSQPQLRQQGDVEEGIKMQY